MGGAEDSGETASPLCQRGQSPRSKHHGSKRIRHGIFGLRDPSSDPIDQVRPVTSRIPNLMVSSIPRGYGVACGPGSRYSLKISVLGSNQPILPPSYFPNQMIPSESIFIRLEYAFGVGVAYGITFSVFASTFPILLSAPAVNQTFPSLSRVMS